MRACIRSALACTSATAGEPIPVDVPAIHCESSLARKHIGVDACIGLPTSANPHAPDDIVLLHPCAAAKDESPLPRSRIVRVRADAIASAP